MFSPSVCGDTPPVNLENIDVRRTTRTNPQNQDEQEIRDCWDGSANDARELSDEWTGETQFEVIDRTELPPGWKMVEGRKHVHKTRRVRTTCGQKCGK